VPDSARFDPFKWTPVVRTDMKFQGRSTTKRSGGRRRPIHKKKKHELGNQPTETTVGEQRLRTVDARGDVEKVRALSTDVANVTDGGETVSAEIENVVENPANPNYVRRNIVTKGAVIETTEGRARVTSRPGQTGQVNAVLLDD
jgi:small subunit ribosomal protein S8e